MGAAPGALTGPPPPPSDITSQMSGFDGVGKQMADSSSGGGPVGALQAQAQTVKKVLEQMATAAGPGKRFFSAALQMIDQGVQAEASNNGAPGGGDAGSQSMQPPPNFPG